MLPRDFDRLTHSISILITKVPLNDIEEEGVIALVEEIIYENQNMNV